MSDTDTSFVKIKFDLQQDEDGYPPYAVENMWAIQRDDGYELNNIAWYARDVACGDLVAAKPDEEGGLTFERVLRRSGNSTLRVYLLTPAAIEDCQAIRQAIQNAGSDSELHGTRFLALDVSATSLATVWTYLEEGEGRGDWTFEVGYLAEP